MNRDDEIAGPTSDFLLAEGAAASVLPGETNISINDTTTAGFSTWLEKSHLDTKDTILPDETGAIVLPPGDPYGIRAVQRAVMVLEQLAKTDDVSITQLAQQVQLHKSTVHRLLVTLEATGMVRQDPAVGRYRLGFKLMELGAAAVRGVELRATAHPHLEGLARATGCTTHLGVMDRGEVVYIDKIEGEGSFRLYSQIGRRAPLHCTGLGKVLTAFLPPAEQKRLTAKPLRRFTRRTIVEPEWLLRHLQQIAREGYAVDDAEHEDLIRCVAAPVRDHTGGVVAAVSVTSVCAELLPADRDRFLGEVLKTTSSISRDLGFDPGPDALGAAERVYGN